MNRIDQRNREEYWGQESSMCRGPVVKGSIVSQWPERRTVDWSGEIRDPDSQCPRLYTPHPSCRALLLLLLSCFSRV